MCMETSNQQRSMTPKERAEAALTLQVPDQIPTFELEFQLEEEFFGRRFVCSDSIGHIAGSQRERLLQVNAEYMVEVYTNLEYSIIPVHYLNWDDLQHSTRYLRQIVGDTMMLTTHGDGTFSIPDGDHLLEFYFWLADTPQDAHYHAAQLARRAIERNKRLIDAGMDSFVLCSDYCFNAGPFMSPAMFSEFVTPYLHQIISETKRAGAYCIKHTDGNIMPILDQLVACEPDGLHSLDPMAGVDIKEVKQLVGDRLCLCGNVNCALMQTGSEDEVIASAEYCIEHGKPGGGYIFCTSNVPFAGLPPERYRLILDVWRKHRDYPF